MSGPHPTQRRAGQRAGRSQPLNGGASLNASLNAISFDEWRGDVDERMDRHDTALQQTAVILERLSNRFDEHDRRLGALEERPKQQQATLVGLGGLVGQYAYLLIAGVLLWLALSPHLGWH